MTDKKTFFTDFFKSHDDSDNVIHYIEQDKDTVFTCPDCNYQHKSCEWKHAFCVKCDTLLS